MGGDGGMFRRFGGRLVSLTLLFRIVGGGNLVSGLEGGTCRLFSRMSGGLFRGFLFVLLGGILGGLVRELRWGVLVGISFGWPSSSTTMKSSCLVVAKAYSLWSLKYSM
jgi:hypothetical protein